MVRVVTSVPTVLRHGLGISAFSLLVAAGACGPNAPTGGGGLCWQAGWCDPTPVVGKKTDPSTPSDQGSTVNPMKPSQDPQISTTSCKADICGNIEWVVSFTLPVKAANAGWVVQEVSVTRNFVGGTGGAGGGGGAGAGTGGAGGGPFAPDASCFHFWEAFWVQAGTTGGFYDLNADDTYSDGDHPKNGSGTVTITGKAKFYEGTLPASFIRCNPANRARYRRSTSSPPDFWDDTGTAHNLTVT